MMSYGPQLLTVTQFGTIITLRIVQIISTIIITSYGGWSTVWPCAKISSIVGPDTTLAFYPGCASFVDGSNPLKEVIVEADFNSENPAEIGAALGLPFGSAGWIALWLHVIFVEVYVRSSFRLSITTLLTDVVAPPHSRRKPASPTGIL